MNYALNEAEMFADITDGTTIIINSMTGIYYGLNGFGTSIFENLLAGSSVEDILSAAKALPEAPQQMEACLDTFLHSLAEFRIILPAPEASRPASLDEKAAAADCFKPECNEYRDVQELLYADPIHEVEEDKGWMPE